MREYLYFTVPESYDERTLETFLRREKHASTRMLRMLKRIPSGLTKNGEHARTVDVLRSGDVVRLFNITEKSDIAPEQGTLDILYEDEDVLLINKPPFCTMHPTRSKQSGTLANYVEAYNQNQGVQTAYRAIGRLDRDTSGVVLLARHMYAGTVLTEQIQDRTLVKTYVALVAGMYKGSGTIDAPIYRPNSPSTKRCVDERGERAVTNWKAVATNGVISLLEIVLETGRTHQIRVHFSHAGTPLLGDDMYGSEYLCINRQALHCVQYEFSHPMTGKRMKVSAPLPKDMAEVVAKFSNNA